MSTSDVAILSLCSGIGGIELGLRFVLKARTVCYVEREVYAAAVLAARMEDGTLDEAPIWSDLRTFDGKPWRGVVDIVTAGFPCQPFSSAGKRRRERDSRHLWPDIARIVEECNPSLVFLENVRICAFREPFRDLRAMGFRMSPPYAITAAELGASHIRRRVFALAFRPGVRIESRGSSGESWTNQTLTFWPRGKKPCIQRVDDGVSNRVDRNRCLGNAVVPAMAARAFVALTGVRFEKTTH